MDQGFKAVLEKGWRIGFTVCWLMIIWFLLSSSFLVFFIGFLIAIIVFFVMKCFHYCNEVITLTWFLGVGGMELLNYETKVCDVMHRFPDVVLRFMF